MSDTQEMETAPACPHCGSTRVVRILYGMVIPTPEELAKPDGLVLGGCVISEDSPKWQCRACHSAFGVIFERRLND